MVALVFLSLGSNLGDRAQNIRRTITLLKHVPQSRLLNSSRLYVSAPVGVRGQPDYLNGVVKIETGLTPMGLLVELKRIESRLGRRAARRWSSRVIDIDILFFGNQKVKTPFLKIPHPRALTRAFVLMPLAELDSKWRRPLKGLRQKCYTLLR